MSLETEIQNLTKAIESLVTALNKSPTTPDLFAQAQADFKQISKKQQIEQTTEVLETIEESFAEPVTAQVPELVAEPKKLKQEDLQAVCQELIRKDVTNKEEIRKVLNFLGATTLGKLPESKYSEFMQQLGNI